MHIYRNKKITKLTLSVSFGGFEVECFEFGSAKSRKLSREPSDFTCVCVFKYSWRQVDKKLNIHNSLILTRNRMKHFNMHARAFRKNTKRSRWPMLPQQYFENRKIACDEISAYCYGNIFMCNVSIRTGYKSDLTCLRDWQFQDFTRILWAFHTKTNKI